MSTSDVCLSGCWSVRPRAEMMPAVTVCSKPSGEPIATATSPTRRFLTLPMTAAGRSSRSTLTTPTSVSASAATRRPESFSPDASVTSMSWAPWTTWALVMMWPSERKITPEPRPSVCTLPKPVSCSPRTLTLTTHGRARAAISTIRVVPSPSVGRRPAI
jgi:hypothetical protein